MSSASQVKVSPSPRKIPHLSSHEAIFMNVEDHLSRNALYIEQNKDRLPTFKTSAEAESELRQLYLKLKHPQNNMHQNEHSEINEKLSQVQKQNDALKEEEDRISALKKITEDARIRENKEFEEKLKVIQLKREKLNGLQQKVSEFVITNESLQKSIADNKKQIQKISKKLESLQKEKEKLQQENFELKEQMQNNKNLFEKLKNDEKYLSSLSNDNQQKQNQINELTELYQNKLQLISSKNKSNNQILTQLQQLEDKFDDEIENAKTFVENAQNQSDISSFSEKDNSSDKINQDINKSNILISPLNKSDDDNDSNSDRFDNLNKKTKTSTSNITNQLNKKDKINKIKLSSESLNDSNDLLESSSDDIKNSFPSKVSKNDSHQSKYQTTTSLSHPIKMLGKKDNLLLNKSKPSNNQKISNFSSLTTEENSSSSETFNPKEFQDKKLKNDQKQISLDHSSLEEEEEEEDPEILEKLYSTTPTLIPKPKNQSYHQSSHIKPNQILSSNLYSNQNHTKKTTLITKGNSKETSISPNILQDALSALEMKTIDPTSFQHEIELEIQKVKSKLLQK